MVVEVPSGTARILTDILLKNLDVKLKGQFGKLDRKIRSDELHFASIRSGSIPGEHIVGFDSAADSIEIRHIARNRKGLAAGALKAAHWISDKKGIYNFSDVFSQIFQRTDDET